MLAGTVPAGIILDRWLAGALEERAREDLAAAPRILADRNAAIGEAMVMHAQALASVPELATAFAAGNRGAARQVLAVGPTAANAGEEPLLVSRDGSAWAGMPPTAALIEATRQGKNPVAVLASGHQLYAIALAPVTAHGAWVGAAGVTRPFDRGTAEMLGGLTRSDVIIVAPDTAIAGATTSDSLAAALALRVSRTDSGDEMRIGNGRYLVAAAKMAPGVTVLFIRDLGRELALVPRLRRVLTASGALALAVALLLGAVLASRVTAPVRTLADAADRLAAGDFGAPLAYSGAIEVRRLAQAFDAMRRALAARLAEAKERSEKLSMLQAQLMQQDRLAATGHLVVQLAHEIRNPVANIRNCLEVIRRRSGDADTLQFTDLAIEELMRMHALAENLLDLNRPRDASGAVSDPTVVVREVEALLKLDGLAVIEVHTNGSKVKAAIGPDALKQILLNLARNAREASAASLIITVEAMNDLVRIDVADDGPGIPAHLLPRIFDPFFTTKTAVHGVGLGLFVAEGLVRSVGGSLTARNRSPE
ncbi:MAG TPA: ATP-binding protein, partial [Gemmatimonadaceae bacterium]|nr:ATP-binding protein [Gemmatimonadaceae bacterium]